MKNFDQYKKNLELGVDIRTEIQDNYREEYNQHKRFFKSFTGEDSKVLKHVVDMYHYRSGGYPNPDSPPKHQELIEKFAQMVKYFDLIGFSKIYQEELHQHGIQIKVLPGHEIEDQAVVPEALEVIQDTPSLATHIKSKHPRYKDVIKAFVLSCDYLQGNICQLSNNIKHGLAPIVEENCEIYKSDFTKSVMTNYQIKKGRISPRRMERMVKELGSKTEVVTLDLKEAEQKIASLPKNKSKKS